MPAVPVPFLASGLLVVVLLVLLRSGTRNLWFLAFLGLAAFQTAIVGMRWSLDIDWLRHLQPVSASLVPVCAFIAFADLDNRRIAWHRHVIWPMAVVASVLLFPSGIDLLLSLEFLLYGWLVFASKAQDGVSPQVRLGSEGLIFRMRRGVAIALVLSAISDLIVSAILALGYVEFAAPIVAMTLSAVLVTIAGGLVGRLGLEVPGEPPLAEAVAEPMAVHLDEAQASEVLQRVEALFEQGLYKDYDLTLARLARRAHIPARTISRAVNHIHGISITDLVNRYRVDEAKRLLLHSDLPVTEIMLEAGFQTKSNFNRVFKELAGQTPSAFRNSGR